MQRQPLRHEMQVVALECKEIEDPQTVERGLLKRIGRNRILLKYLENPTTNYVNVCAKGNTNGQVPVDLSRMMVTVSTLHPLEERYA